MMREVLLILGAFFAGSIPFGLFIGRAKGIDIRQHGSGNIGATNVGRVLGRKFFFLCFALDFLKGFAPTLGAGIVLGAIGGGAREWADQRVALVWLAVMVAAVLGHVFSPWLKFKGGKGVATALGAMMGVFPHFTIAGAGAFIVWLLALAVWRTISVSSILAGLALPVIVVVDWLLMDGPLFNDMPREQGRVVRFEDGWPYMAVAVLLAGLVVWTHRANIKRLRAGTEPRVGEKKGVVPGSQPPMKG
ncbi:MAG TPA: glycerol-3-phosphate 1-O-acyltransferase PlsY [Phycisphaerales bacterium]|nr:glycerol-3-phosphate 1-O-acyltransferase PlsY [Phycisphaerales bacterium]